MRQLLGDVDHYVNQQNGEIEWMVDSYQDDLQIPLQVLSDLDVRIIFLVRDVRSWVHSRVHDINKKGKSLPGIRSLGLAGAG